MGDRQDGVAGWPAGPAGTTYWVTGLPGAGKSTLARALADRLRATGRSVVALDGGRLRPIIGARHGYGRADRQAMGHAYGQLCREFSGQGHDVVCATVSLFDEVRRWNRDNIAAYREIYLRVSIDTLIARHPKGLQAAARAGRIRNVPGVDLAIEEPRLPDVLIDDDGDLSPEEVAGAVFGQLWPSCSAL